MKKRKLVGLLVCLGLFLSLFPGSSPLGRQHRVVQAQDPRNVDIVFVMDTSGSMDDDFSALCGNIESLITNLQAEGIIVRYQILGITDTRQCATGTVQSTVLAPISDHEEDWGPAVRDLAVGYQWQPGATRLAIPISDEAPEDGDECDAPGPDEDAIRQAVTAATANQVRVAPIMARGHDDYGSCPADLAQMLASGTGGYLFFSTTPADDLALGVQDLIGAVVADRDGDGIADDDDPYPDDPCQPDPQVVCLPRQICGVSNTPRWDDDWDGSTDEELPNSSDDDGDGLIDEDVGGPNCPFPQQDCGVNSHRAFDDDGDGKADEEGDNGIDDDGDSYVDEDVDCPCPLPQDLSRNETPGVDDDHDFRADEETDDGQDSDGDGCIDEDIGLYSEEAQIDLVSVANAQISSLVSMPMYTRGQDSVDLDVEVSSPSGGTFALTGFVVDFQGTTTYLPPENVSLQPGETQTVDLVWPIPVDALMWHYSIGADLALGDGSLADTEQIDDALFVAGITEEEMKENEWKCLGAWEVCGVATAGVVPYAGIPFNWLAISDLMCAANERFGNGDWIGGILVILRIINAFVEAVHQIAGAVTLVLNATSAFHSAIGGAADCAESHLHEFLADECGPKGYTCWIGRMFSDLGSIFKKNTTVVMVAPAEGTVTSISHLSIPLSSTPGVNFQGLFFRAQTAYAADVSPPVRLRLADSNGDFVEFTDRGERNISGVGMVYSLGDEVQMAVLEGTGPHKEVELLGQSNGIVDLHILQVNEDGTTSQATFESIETSPGSVASVNVSSTGSTSDLELDKDGDGLVDRRISPGESGSVIPPGSSGGGGLGIAIIVLALAAGGLFIYAVNRSRGPRSGTVAVSQASLTGLASYASGQSYPISKDGFLIGRGSTCDVRIPDRAVSRQHARIRYAQGSWFIQDQDSAIGTYVNGQRVQATRLAHGDLITIGNTEFEFRIT